MVAREKIEYPPFTPELVADGLLRLGLKRSDVLFIHSSVKDLAPARQMLDLPDFGMPYVLMALKEVIGPEGLIVLPTFSFCFAKSRYGPTGMVWDKRETPSKVGDLTNYFWRQRGVLRSDHPTHSVAALGDRAAEFVADHCWNSGSTFHINGPWGKLCQWDGYILFLGTYINSCTAIHVAEDWMELPYLVEAEALIKDENEDVQTVKVPGSPIGWRDFYRKNSKIEKRFLASGIYTSDKICMADVTLFKARDFIRFMWRSITEDPWVLLVKDEKDEFCWNAGLATEKHMAAFNKPCPF